MIRVLGKCGFGEYEDSKTSIALNKIVFESKIIDNFLFLHENICCGYSLEAPHRGASNEYPQHMFSWRNKKNIDLVPSLILTYAQIRILGAVEYNDI